MKKIIYLNSSGRNFLYIVKIKDLKIRSIVRYDKPNMSSVEIDVSSLLRNIRNNQILDNASLKDFNKFLEKDSPEYLI